MPHLARPGRRRPTSGAARALAVTALLLALPASGRAAPVGWRMDGTGNFPEANPPLEWSSSRNVRWATPMPGWSNSSPILVGGRLLVASEPDVLVCLDAATGEILWQRASPVTDAVTHPIEEPPFLQVMSRESEIQPQLAEREVELSELRRRGATTPGDPSIVDRARTLAAEVTALRRELAALAPYHPPQTNEENGHSSPTPTSDGELVYAFFGSGVLAAYDLDGERRWIRFVDKPGLRDGLSASPVLAGDAVLVQVNDLIALDRATGEIRWRAPAPARQGTPVAFEIDGVPLVLTPSGHCVRVSDGLILASGIGDLDYPSPLIDGDTLYMIERDAEAFRIPAHLTEPLRFERLWKSRLKGLRYYSSPLKVGDLIYAITRRQILTVLDARTGTEIYAERMDLGRTGGANAQYASPTQGGDHVFVSGLGGTTVVLEPGRSFTPVATNELESFRASPIFDGDKMYVRGHQHFYCIARTMGGDGSAP